MLVDAQGLHWHIRLPLFHAPAEPPLTAATGLGEASRSPVASAGSAGPGPQKSAGKRLLVVEDEPLIGLEVVASLQKAGAEALGPVGSSEQALAIIEKEPLNGALLDANLHGKPVDNIAAALTRRRVPFVFVTGYGPASLPLSFWQGAGAVEAVYRGATVDCGRRAYRAEAGSAAAQRLTPACQISAPLRLNVACGLDPPRPTSWAPLISAVGGTRRQAQPN
jgi:CheY-like chemotaxis protein